MNDAVLPSPVRLFPIFLVLISATRDIDQSTIHGALTFSNNSYFQTINRAARQLLTENKSETRRRRFIADDLSLRKIIRHTTMYNVMKNGHRRDTRGRVRHMRAIPPKVQQITRRNSL